MNFILAFVLFALHIQMAGIPVENPTYVQIGEITKGMPADEADLKEETSSRALTEPPLVPIIRR